MKITTTLAPQISTSRTNPPNIIETWHYTFSHIPTHYVQFSKSSPQYRNRAAPTKRPSIVPLNQLPAELKSLATYVHQAANAPRSIATKAHCALPWYRPVPAPLLGALASFALAVPVLVLPEELESVLEEAPLVVAVDMVIAAVVWALDVVDMVDLVSVDALLLVEDWLALVLVLLAVTELVMEATVLLDSMTNCGV